ncbi:unnamed protein product [Kuraishia capsulata CBS 1993]|uniref:Serine/threonine-protein kinase TOR n=1 Tax=Kuraishia capsulata CBS 1993 TaxID=1382522 RepID=W6MNZ9_9ASCO|nr:uncharacterized protein KUCA_T00002766001 [Kuraishia capsulata CBS 1993]CDK26792.1 unnamed protein product [Kuraishia capsulata CBS 1993]
MSSQQSTDNLTLNYIFAGLGSKNPIKRQKAARSLKDHLISISRDFVSSEQWSLYNSDINKRVFELIHSPNATEQMGGVEAINALLDLITNPVSGISISQNSAASLEENTSTITRYANYLRRLIPSNDLEVMKSATKTLGKLAIPGGSLTGDFVEFEIKRSIEWLVSDKQEVRRHAAVLTISALAYNSPTSMFQYLKDILGNIWIALRDPKLAIREDAGVCLRYCLRLAYERDNQMRAHWFTKLYSEASQGVKSIGTNSSTVAATTETVHGSLICFHELIFLGTEVLAPKVDDLYEILMRLKDHKSQEVRKEVTVIIPILANYDRTKFVEKFMHRIMLYFLSQLTHGKDRVFILRSVGDIATEVKSNIVSYLDGGILANIKDALSTKVPKARKELEPACFYCLSKLAIAIGTPLTKFINNYQILKLVFKSSINDSMLELLRILIENLPSLEPVIDERLLNVVSMCLSGYEFKHPGSPDFKRAMSPSLAYSFRQTMLQKDGGMISVNTVLRVESEISSDELSLASAYEDGDVAVILQALKALNFFDFRNYSLTEFVRYSVITYIEHDNPEVRLKSALTSCAIFLKDPICLQSSERSLRAVGEVLDKLLTLCITDPVPEIRLEMLKSLGERFDPQLSQADNVRLLFTSLNDEYFEIRKTAIKLVGRLSAINPAYIVPSLRKLLIQLLTSLEYGGTSARKKEETATLLHLLIANSRDITKPYVKPILDVLIPKAKDESSSVASSSIVAIGELSIVGGDEMLVFIKELMPILLDTFQDQSSSYKRDAALKTLGQLSGSSGYVIQPLLDYPQLLGMLVNILKSESSAVIRRETVRLLGILGALDPYKHREVERNSQDSATVAEQNAPSIDMALLMKGMSPSNEEYFPTVVINTLLKILKDPSLSTHHPAVIQAIMHIFKTLGTKCVPFLKQVIPGFARVARTCPLSMLEIYFQQLSDLVKIVRLHIRNYLSDIFALIEEFFHLPMVQVTIIGLIEQISKALDGEFKMYMLDIITLMLDVLEQDKSPNRFPSLRVLKAFVVFGSNIEVYFHLIVPQIVRMFEFGPQNLRKAAIGTVGKISRDVNLNDMTSRIIQPLLRVLSNGNEELRVATMNTLCLLLLQLGNEFTIFVPVINKVLVKNRLQYPIYDQLVDKLLNGETLPQNLVIDQDIDTAGTDHNDIEPSARKLPVNQQALKNTWDASQRRTKEDWQDWIRRLSVELLKESPSHALRACAALASVYHPLAKDLFNCSFASCWNELNIQNQGELAQAFCVALSSPNNPPEIHQTLLNLAEYLEHDEKSLPIRIQILSQYAQRSHVYAKALHYKELEFIQEPSTPTIESLISINNQLQQSDAAIGILKYAQEHHGLQLKETWYEKLQRWDDALRAYNERELEEPNSMEITMGKMRCLHALGEWEQLSELAQEKWNSSSGDIRRAVAPLAAAASWGLGQWERMHTYISVMKQESPDKAFFNAILCLHKNNFDEASDHILKARDLLVTEITALVSESYNRAYGVVVRVQMLAELEEIIKYKCYAPGSEKRIAMRATWNKRLLGCQRNVDIWQRMLKVRALVVKPKQDMEMWIKFANLCRKSGRLGLAEKSLNSLLDEGNVENHRPSRAPPHVVYAQLKYMWAKGQKREALNHLVDFTSKLSHDLGLNENESITQPLPTDAPGAPDHVEKYTKLLARCYLKQGEWKVALNNNWRSEEAAGILGSYLLATHFDNKWYKAWHNWALANFEVISPQSGGEEPPVEIENGSGDSQFAHILHYVFPAIKGFFYSISLSELNPLQDTLRLLTLWFKFGGIDEAAKALAEGFSMVRIDTWLNVIPQLISRIHQPNVVVSRALLGLLSDLGKAHPQALVYPLTVAIKSDSVSRQRAALTIIEKMRAHSSTLVDQAELVSNELIRVAVLWHEMWYEGLEDASRAYFGEQNIEKMYATLNPLHALLERGPQTIRETSFYNAFAKDLSDAYQWIINYNRTKDTAYLNQGWDLYYSVFRRISRQLSQLQNLDLQHVSPKLLATKNLELVVPGTYVSGKEICKIAYFHPMFTVITSKQRPRKFSIMGSDGKDYTFLLKGHEDIRQDSLVMQLFGLVNTLLVNDPECFKRHLDIQQFPAIPLSPSSGLLGWVPNSDTFHVLIKEYREPRKILLDVEHRIMLQMSPDYDNLTLLEKVEVFTYALDITRGQDLYKVLWFKSKSSEAWLDRRTTYTRSLAVMSMAGYILGLGDRHPSNLMMDRITGKVIHIDFGDCFEAAILREKFPEKVPFRLTRMLSYAMEVSGIEGSFRITSENVMRVLRNNKESLMAILEAFAYDPLINWGFDFPLRDITGGGNIKLPLNNPAELLRAGQIDKAEAVRLEQQYKTELRNARASLVLKRITDKLTGNDFKRFEGLNVPQQVDKLIQQATSVENLCQHYIGWCSFW